MTNTTLTPKKSLKAVVKHPFFGFIMIGVFLIALQVIAMATKGAWPKSSMLNGFATVLIFSIVGFGFTYLLGLIVGFISLRIEGIFLAIVTLGLSEIFYQIFNNWIDFTNGPNGASIAKAPIFQTLLGMGSADARRWFFIFLVVLTVFLMMLTHNLGKSSTGRVRPGGH